MVGKRKVRRIRLREGFLGRWSVSQASMARRKVLAKLVRKDSSVTIFRRLNALAVLNNASNKKRSVKVYKTAVADRNWVKMKYMKK